MSRSTESPNSESLTQDQRWPIWQRVSLQSRLVALVVTMVALSVMVSGVVGAGLLRSYLINQVDADLETVAQSPGLARQLLRAADLPFPSDAAGPTRGGPGRMPEDVRSPIPSDYYLQVNLADGTAIASINSAFTTGAPDLTDVDLGDDSLFGTPQTVPGLEPITGTATAQPPNWRLVVVPVGADATVLVARDLGDVEAIMLTLALVIVTVGAVVIALVGALSWYMVRRNLQPLARIEAAAVSIANGDLTTRPPPASASTEVGRMSQAITHMTDQLVSLMQTKDAALVEREEALQASQRLTEHMRDFVADASHELRTPLTAIAGYAELLQQQHLAETERPRALAALVAQTDRMSRLVDDLLMLARLDDQQPRQRQNVDMLELVTQTVAQLTPGLAADEVRIEVTASQAPVVQGDEGQLAQVVANLLTNALRYGKAPVVLAISREQSESKSPIVMLRVVDHGPGIDPGDRTKVFDRFTRLQQARERAETGTSSAVAAQGTGLGLSIVAAIVQAHAGAVWCEGTPGGGATFVLTLPAG